MTSPARFLANLLNSSGNVPDAKLVALTASKLTGQVPDANAPSGSVIQVVSVTKTDVFTSTTANTWLDIPGLSVSITPSSATSNILVMYTVAATGVNGVNGIFLRALRDSIAIGVGTSATGSRLNAGIGVLNTDNNWSNTAAQTILDSPVTTSATTYKVQGRVNAGTLLINRTANDTDNTFIGRFASSLTVMEIAA